MSDLTIVKTERPDGFKERHDCGVLALAAALGVPYADAHAALREAGRVSHSGTFTVQIERALVKRGVPYTRRMLHGEGRSRKGYVKRVTCAKVLDHVPARGRFVVGSTDHYFAVIDGVVYDNGGFSPKAYLEVAISVDVPAPSRPIDVAPAPIGDLPTAVREYRALVALIPQPFSTRQPEFRAAARRLAELYRRFGTAAVERAVKAAKAAEPTRPQGPVEGKSLNSERIQSGAP